MPIKSNALLQIDESWQKVLENELNAVYFADLQYFVEEERTKHTVYPPSHLTFSAYQRTPFNKVKVVIIGQDPYHGENQANGLCFSVSEGVKLPPSLRNIFKELSSDIEIDYPTSGNLEPWADQGVFMLNATLSVRESEAGSHQKKGWERFTDATIREISTRLEHVVFILWGNFAQAKEKLIDTSKHHIIKSPHPSPLSVRHGFYESKPFSKANEYLHEHGFSTIDWTIN